MSHTGLASRRHSMAGAFVFLLLALFAVFSTVMVLFSVRLYRSAVEQTGAHNARRVLYSYLLNTVRANDREGAVSVREENGVDVLVLGWEDGYETLIYAYNGELRELLLDAGEPFDPELGETVCAAQGFRPALQGSLLTLELTDGAGESGAAYVPLACPTGKGAAR